MSKILKALEKAQKETTEHVTGEGSLEGGAVRGPVVAVPEPGPSPARAAPGMPSEPAPARAGDGGSEGRSTLSLAAVDPYIEVLHRPMSMVSEQYRSLRNRLERTSAQGGQRVIALTSAVKGEGKTLTAVNLALTLGQDPDRRVLLVDADLRRPRVHQVLGLEQSPGLADLLHGRETPDRLARPVHGGLDVVPAGTPGGHPGELLAGDELRRAVAEWRRRYDFVLLDTPPVHPIADVAFLADAVDGYVVVVRARKTSREQLEQLEEHLPLEKIVGSVLNRAEDAAGGYGYKKDGYGYAY